eukprot:7799989-Alexandrium_andersonii.AAC.1
MTQPSADRAPCHPRVPICYCSPRTSSRNPSYHSRLTQSIPPFDTRRPFRWGYSSLAHRRCYGEAAWHPCQKAVCASAV